MNARADAGLVAERLRVSIGLLVRRLRQLQIEGDLTLPETAALKRLESTGPTTASALAKLEQISPQSMGATLNALFDRACIKRTPDPQDGRQTINSLTAAGREALRNRRSARTKRLAIALSENFTPSERQLLMAAAPLLERLAENL